MSAPANGNPSNLSGKPRRSISGQGGLLSRMFGNSNGNGKETSNDTASNARQSTHSGSDATPNLNTNAANESRDSLQKDLRSPTRKPEEPPAAEKKRRSSGVGRARDLFSSAKQSLHNLGSSPENRSFGEKPQTSMQKLGRADPALSVPQGSTLR